MVRFGDVMLSEGMLKPSCRYYVETFAGNDNNDNGNDSGCLLHLYTYKLIPIINSWAINFTLNYYLDSVSEDVLKKCFRVGKGWQMERLVYEEFVDESDYKEEYGHGYCDGTNNPPAAGKNCKSCDDCPVGGKHTEKGGGECRYGLDHSSPDYSDSDWKMMVQVHLLTAVSK